MKEMICIHKGPWISSCKTAYYTDWGPKYGEICEVSPGNHFTDHYVVRGYEEQPNGKWAEFKQKWFAEVADISELEEILQTQTQEA